MSADTDLDDLSDTIDPDVPKKKENSLRDWVIVVVIAISSALLVRNFVLQQFQVVGTSMINTLHEGDRVLVNRLSYRLHDPNRGDVVVLHRLAGTTNERDLIKRVIGLPGETVEIRDCQVYIDGRLLVEPYLDPQISSCTLPDRQANPYLVPDEHVFVIGDNRSPSGSGDSRSFGSVSESDLVGRAFVVIWPRDDWQWL
jgi:signal peptidase I